MCSLQCLLRLNFCCRRARWFVVIAKQHSRCIKYWSCDGMTPRYMCMSNDNSKALVLLSLLQYWSSSNSSVPS
jgi:hypothetical protein